MKEIRKMTTRVDLNRLPALPLPVYVRSVGFSGGDSGWAEDNSPAEFVQLYWIESGTFLFEFEEDRKQVLHAGETIYRMPGERRKQSAITPGDNRHYWVTFDGPGAADFMRSYAYPQEALNSGKCPTQLFQEIELLMTLMTPYSQRRMVSLLTEILALMGGGDEITTRTEKLINDFMTLVQTGYDDPGTNINALSERLGVHRTTLNRVFQQKMNLSPIEYLIRFRIQKALILLQNDSIPIAEVADRVGIPHHNYFSRTVQKMIGMTPKAYRMRHLSG